MNFCKRGSGSDSHMRDEVNLMSQHMIRVLNHNLPIKSHEQYMSSLLML